MATQEDVPSKDVPDMQPDGNAYDPPQYAPGLDGVSRSEDTTSPTTPSVETSDEQPRVEIVRTEAPGIPDEAREYAVSKPYPIAAAALFGVGLLSYRGFLIFAIIVLCVLLLAELARCGDRDVGYSHSHARAYALDDTPARGIYLHQ